ncbi:hypothetical protein M758_2G205200 [Ceratodon purpureus]|nr:hypothetical protein M758_2G205200 [Ceratodon purpureus]
MPWDAATSTRQCRSITHCILCSPLKRQSSSVSELPCRNRVRLNDYLRSSISNLQPTLTAEAQRVRFTAHSVSSAICYDVMTLDCSEVSSLPALAGPLNPKP